MDTWAVGVMLVEMLSRVSPFRGADRDETVDNVLDLRWEPPAAASADAAQLMHQLMHSSPQQRLALSDVASHPFCAAFAPRRASVNRPMSALPMGLKATLRP